VYERAREVDCNAATMTSLRSMWNSIGRYDSLCVLTGCVNSMALFDVFCVISYAYGTLHETSTDVLIYCAFYITKQNGLFTVQFV